MLSTSQHGLYNDPILFVHRVFAYINSHYTRFLYYLSSKAPCVDPLAPIHDNTEGLAVAELFTETVRRGITTTLRTTIMALNIRLGVMSCDSLPHTVLCFALQSSIS